MTKSELKRLFVTKIFKSLFLTASVLLLAGIVSAQNITLDGRTVSDVDILVFDGMSEPSTSSLGKAWVYFDSVAGKLKCSEDGDAYADCIGAGSGDVTASSAFGTDNVLIKSDGTGKGVQATGISIADTTNNVTGLGTLNTHTIPGGTGTLALTSQLHDEVTLTGTGTYLSITGQAITVDPITESDISDLGSYITASSTDTLTNKTFDANGTGNSLTILAGTTPTVDTAGQIAVDTTADDLIYYGGSKRSLPYHYSKGGRLESPADADSFLFWKAPYPLTITDINCIVDPADTGESVVIDLQECDGTGDNCATVDATITCDNDGAADDGTLSNGAIDEGDWLLLDIGTVTGTVTNLSLEFTYTKTAE